MPKECFWTSDFQKIFMLNFRCLEYLEVLYAEHQVIDMRESPILYDCKSLENMCQNTQMQFQVQKLEIIS